MELQWIGVAFVLGLVARRLGQPPLLGFLAAGFVLEGLGLRPDASLRELADVGIQLLLFGIGLKLDLRTVIKPQVWATTLLHMGSTVVVFGGLFVALALLRVPMAADVGLAQAGLLGFARPGSYPVRLPWACCCSCHCAPGCIACCRASGTASCWCSPGWQPPWAAWSSSSPSTSRATWVP